MINTIRPIPSSGAMILIGANNARFYYFDYHMINEKNPDGLLAKDLKKIGK